MKTLRIFISRFAAVISRRRRDADLRDEIQAHLDALIEQHVRGGMSLRDAIAAARRDFGGVEQIKEAYRDQRGWPILDALGQDLRYAARVLRKNPGFAAAAVLTFGVGIGATTAAFTVVNAVLIRELPYPNARRVVQIYQTLPQRNGRPPSSTNSIAEDQLRRLRAQSRTLVNVAFWSGARVTLSGAGDPVAVNGARISSGFFEAFGIRPRHGRSFTIDDESSGAERVVILSHAIWTRRFGRDAAAIGRTVRLDGMPYRIVGVMGEEVAVPELSGVTVVRDEDGNPDVAPQFWTPLTLSPPAGQLQPGFTLRPAIASIAAGFTREQAVAEAGSLIGPLPDGARPIAVNLKAVRDQMVGGVRQVLIIVQGAMVFVLLIACANVANLLLARASRQRRELAIRLALGAGRWRVASACVAECVLLAGAGSLLALAIASGAVTAIRSLPPEAYLARTREIHVDAIALAFNLTLSLAAGAVVGVLVTMRVLWNHDGRFSDRDVSHLAIKGRPSDMLVVAEIATAMVLLVGGGLLVTSFVKLVSIDPGFETRNVLTFNVDVPPVPARDNARGPTAFTRLVEALSALPDVEAVTATASLPFSGYRAISEPIVVDSQRHDTMVAWSTIGAGYFRALRVPLQEGREFSVEDRVDSPRVVMVSESFAKKFIGGAGAIDHELRLMDWPSARVVGVVPDPKRYVRSPQRGLSFPEIFFPIEQPIDGQQRPRRASLVVRTAGNPLVLVPALRRTVAALDPSLSATEFAVVDQLLADQSARTRIYGVSAAGFAATAVFLAVVGLYGLLSYVVASRTQEFGVRMALGADAANLIRQIVRQGLRLASIGVALGLAGSWLTNQLLRGLLFGVTPTDPATLVSVTALFLAVASIACYIPARRASRVDPMVALRHE